MAAKKKAAKAAPKKTVETQWADLALGVRLMLVRKYRRMSREDVRAGRMIGARRFAALADLIERNL